VSGIVLRSSNFSAGGGMIAIARHASELKTSLIGSGNSPGPGFPPVRARWHQVSVRGQAGANR
jgi:hypothetical protein